MIRKRNSKFKNTINTPEDYFNSKEYNKNVMFEKRKNKLIKQFFYLLDFYYYTICHSCFLLSLLRGFNFHSSFIHYLCEGIT